MAASMRSAFALYVNKNETATWRWSPFIACRVIELLRFQKENETRE